jgi:hypothetical protein
MGLIVSYVDPNDGQTKTNGYAYAAETRFNWAEMIGSIRFNVHPSYEAAIAGRPPVIQVVFDLPKLTPTDPDACPSLTELVTQHAAAYGALAEAVDTFALTRPIFAGGSVRT